MDSLRYTTQTPPPERKLITGKSVGETREQKIQQAVTAPVQVPTQAEANAQTSYYNKTLTTIDSLRGKNYTMPASVAGQTGAPAETAAPVKVERMPKKEEATINNYSRWIEGLERDRHEYSCTQGKLPPPLPKDLAEANMYGTVKYYMQSHATDAFPDQRKEMLGCMKAAEKDYKAAEAAGDKSASYSTCLASRISRAGAEGKIYQPLAATGDEYIRSCNENAPSLGAGKKYDTSYLDKTKSAQDQNPFEKKGPGPYAGTWGGPSLEGQRDEINRQKALDENARRRECLEPGEYRGLQWMVHDAAAGLYHMVAGEEDVYIQP